MRRTITLPTLIVLAMLATNIVGSIPVTSVFTHSINVNRIDPMGAAPGNANKAAIEISVKQLGDFICGLNVDNFILNTLKTPSYDQNLTIYSVGSSSASRGGGYSACNYSINVAPASDQGRQYTWEDGTYILQLNYIKNGRQLANETFNFTVT